MGAAEQEETRGLPLPLLRWRGLTLQMFLFTILPLAALLLAIAFGSQALHHQAMRALVGERDLRAVRLAASGLAQSVNRRAAALDLLALSLDGQPPDAALLEQAAAGHGFDGGLAVFDSGGQVVAHSPGAAPALLAEGGALAPGSRPALTQDQGERWLLASGPAAGPYRLAGAFSPGALARESLAGLTGGTATLLLVDSGGELLYQYGHLHGDAPLAERPGVAEVLRGESGVNYISGNQGSHHGEEVIAFTQAGDTGWGLVLQEPWEATASPLLRVSQSAPLILAPVMMLAIFTLWFGARQVVQPLQALEQRAGRLAAGDFAAIREPVGGISEIHNLQEALVKMSAALAAAQDALHGYIGALTAGVENERRALARELHDDTLQALIALNQHVQMTMLRAQDEAQRKPLADLQARVSQTIASLRRAIGGLRPIYLEDLGLVAALGMLAQEIGRAGDMEVTFEQQGAERRLPPEAELAFYRITQEALNNAAHHSGARRARVALAFEPEAARLTISDDGRGFDAPKDPNAFARLGHYGLLGMRERADLAGAKLEIDTAPGRGTRITVTRPL